MMPTTIEASSPPMERRNSTFSYSPEMDRFRSSVISRSTEHIRTESIDSGIGSPVAFATPGIAVAMKRCGSDSLKRSRRDSSPFNNIGEQTQLLVQKMMVLEQKLKSMDTQLKHEQVQRLTLEAKVVKLEEDNERLKGTRVKAGRQLQEFADRFYAATEAINFSTSPIPSPHPSVAELRSRSRTNSISSSSGSLTSRGSRLSAISF